MLSICSTVNTAEIREIISLLQQITAKPSGECQIRNKFDFSRNLFWPNILIHSQPKKNQAFPRELQKNCAPQLQKFMRKRRRIQNVSMTELSARNAASPFFLAFRLC